MIYWLKDWQRRKQQKRLRSYQMVVAALPHPEIEKLFAEEIKQLEKKLS